MLTVGAGMGESDGLDGLEESSIKRPGWLPTFSPRISQTNNTISQPPHCHRHHQTNTHLFTYKRILYLHITTLPALQNHSLHHGSFDG
jgi:hypothetical protein